MAGHSTDFKHIDINIPELLRYTWNAEILSIIATAGWISVIPACAATKISRRHYFRYLPPVSRLSVDRTIDEDEEKDDDDE